MDILNQLKQEFLENQNSYLSMRNEINAQITHSVLTRGFPQNVFPYEWELSGKGKINSTEVENIPPKTMSDNFFHTHYNDKNQIVLSEQWSFGKFRYISIYYYSDNGIIQCFNWSIPASEDDYKLESISLLEVENNRAKRKYNYSPIASLVSIEDYVYQNGTLLKMNTRTSINKEKTLFEYDKEHLLSRIIRTFSNDKSVQQIYPRIKWINTED